MKTTEFADRWVGSRKGKVGSVDAQASALRLHVLAVPVRGGVTAFGDLKVSEVTRDDVEDVVASLDVKVASEGRFAWKTAQNVWGIVTKMFDDAKNAKDRSVRVRADNPCVEVRGPDRGVKKQKQYLYPSEFMKLMKCPFVPLHCKEFYAGLVYTYMRVGEYEALLSGDIDTDAGVIRIGKAVCPTTGGIKAPKSGKPRAIPIEPAVLGMFRRMKAYPKIDGAKGILWTGDPSIRCDLLRAHLEAAGIDRPSLHKDTETSKRMTIHDLRATGITWAAVRGDDHLKIMQRAGHKNTSTSLIYIREADNLRISFGQVFPQLPF
jgi:integrase